MHQVFMDLLEMLLDQKVYSKVIKKITKWILEIVNEALREVALDIKEGSRYGYGKTWMPYLDIIQVSKR